MKTLVRSAGTAGVRALALLAVLAAGKAPPAGAAEVPIPDAPTRWATDRAGLLSAATRASLDARLEAYERTTGRQVIVYIDQTTGDTPLEDWTVRAFEKWKLGRKKLDDGLALFVFAADRRLRIEVGYGLEHVMPDARAVRIIREVAVPQLAAGDADAAVTGTVSAILDVLGGTEDGGAGPGGGSAARGQPPGRGPPARELTRAEKLVLAIVVIAFLVLLVTNPTLALYLLSSIMSGGRGGGYGGGGGGGGFSGGGGRSGGGGASGSW